MFNKVITTQVFGIREKGEMWELSFWSLDIDPATYYVQDHGRCSINIYATSKWTEARPSFLIWRSKKWPLTLHRDLCVE